MNVQEALNKLNESPLNSLKNMQESLNKLSESPFNSLNNYINNKYLPDIEIESVDRNPAKRTYERLMDYIKTFEENLDNEQEVGATLANFGQTLTFHIQNIGYWGPDIITFDGCNHKGERVQLIQNVSQLNILLVALKKLNNEPIRVAIGFKLSKEE